MKKILFWFILMNVLTACPDHDKYHTCDLPDTPVNLVAFNSAYDDYNSTAPVEGRLIPFCFSSNRNSSGNDFDVIYMPMNISFDRQSGILTIMNNYESWEDLMDYQNLIPAALSKIKTSGNELGPNLFETGYKRFTLLYANDAGGNFDIKFTYKKNDSTFSDPGRVTFLNSEHDDLYPSIDNEKNRIYFCSDRQNNNFDIYYAEVNKNYENFEDIFADTLTVHTIKRDAVLSSDSNDKCPFIFQKYLIFASDRPGGFGGYDLYYSVYENNAWSTPVNFGEKINSAYDEYRPILIYDGVTWMETMMIFSSNRPGGKGGFDLYYVGVPFQN